ncbi:MAG: glycosyltransferase family 4 protein [Planctomycetales bacterium]
MWFMVLIFGGALGASWGLTFLAMLLGRHFRILDYPDKERKRHARATPRTGGLAVLGTVLVGVLALSFDSDALGGLEPSSGHFLAMLALSAGLLCLLGLWDDKWGMQARTKLFWQVLAILPFVCLGRSSTAVNVLGWRLDSLALTIPLILFWLVSCTNFVNLMDGLDGLASSVGLIIALATAALAILDHHQQAALMSFVVAGALTGFLIHNRPPARIFLGDSGSLPLGFLLGALSLESAAKKAAGMTLAVPLVLLCIPMFDTSMAILRRKLNGRRIGQGDRAHIHHCLRDRGLSATQTLLSISAMCAMTAAAAIASTAWNSDWLAVGTCLGLLTYLVLGRVFGFDETMLLARHVQAISGLIRGLSRALRGRLFAIRLEASVDSGRGDLWEKIVKRARRLPGVELTLTCEELSSGREVASRSWSSPSIPPESGTEWAVSYAVPREDGLIVRAFARGQLPVAGSALPFQELAEMLAALCRYWPIDAMHAPAAVPSLELPVNLPVWTEPRAATQVNISAPARAGDEPQILSPRWPAHVGIHRELPPGSTVEQDAA